MGQVAAWHVLQWDERRQGAYTIHNPQRVSVGQVQRMDARPVLYALGYHGCPLLSDAFLYAPPVKRPAVQRCMLESPHFSAGSIIGVSSARRCLALWGEEETRSFCRAFLRVVVREMGRWVEVGSAAEEVLFGDGGDWQAALTDHQGRIPSLTGSAYYAHRAVYHALVWQGSPRPTHTVRFALERAALACAYARQGGRQKELSLRGEVFLREEMARFNAQLESLAEKGHLTKT